MRLGCLHTAAGNVAVLERAAGEHPGLALHHDVRPELLVAMIAASGLTPSIVHDVRRALERLASACDVVLLTCSSLGAVADEMAKAAPKPILRIDRALAAAAVADGGRVVVLCTAPTSVEPTGRLFRKAASGTDARIDMRLLPDAWALYCAGDSAGYRRRVADAVADALDDGAARVALAQFSMADAVAPSARVLTSPSIGLAAAMAAQKRA